MDLKVVSVDGQTTMSAFEMSGVPVPARQFAADAADVRVDQALVRLLFAQMQPVGEGLLSLLVVQMSFESVKQWLAQVNDDFRKKISSLPAYAKEGSLTGFNTRADQTVIFPASVALIGYAGGFGAIDFYYSSPFAVGQMMVTHKIALDPVARVHLPTGTLLAVLEKLDSVAQSFPNLEGDANE